MNAIQLRNLLGLTAVGACLVAMVGCIGTASTTGNDGAQLATQTKGTAADSMKADSACGHHERADKDSLEAKGANDDRDSADAKGETEIGSKGCHDGDHHGIEGGHEDKDEQDVKSGGTGKSEGDSAAAEGNHEGTGGEKAGADHETDDDSLKVAGAPK